MSSSQRGHLADYSALEGRLAPSADVGFMSPEPELVDIRIVRRAHDLRASCLQRRAGPHGGPADTLRTSHRADNGPPWLPASRVLDENRWSLGTTHLSACMGVACTAPRTVGCV